MFPTVCINNNKVEHLLTLGKVYIVKETSPAMVLVKTDAGDMEWFDKNRFNENGYVLVQGDR